MPSAGTPFLGEILSIATALIWAGGVVLFKKSGESMQPMALNIFKNIVALVLFVPTIPLFGESFLPDQPAKDWVLLAVSGFLGIAIADTLFFISLNKLGAGLVAVVDTMYTPFVLALSFVFLKEHLGPRQIAGAVLIMIALIVGSASKPEPGRTRKDIVEGVLIGILNMALVSVGIVLIKEVLNRAPMIWCATFRLAVGATCLVPLILLSRNRTQLLSSLRPSRRFLFPALAAVLGSYLSMILWIGGMKYTQVSIAAVLNQLSTIFIFVLAVLFLKEPLTRRRVAAIVLALAGALLIM